MKEDKDDLENIKFVEIMSDTEKLKQWDKTDYNNYLKSLRYHTRFVAQLISFKYLLCTSLSNINSIIVPLICQIAYAVISAC